MILKWFRKSKKDYPNFWMDYISHFKNVEKSLIENTRFVAFDTETTGFDKKNDRILSIGAVTFVGKSIHVNNSLELYLEQEVFNPETVKIHGLMKKGSLQKVTELEAIKIFLAYIKNAVLIAHHANFDKNMINEMLLRHGLGKLKNKFIDTGYLFNQSKHVIYRENLKDHYSLDDLCKELNVPKVDRHTANGDALITAIVFLKILSRLDKRKKLQWDYLLS
ncbi:3'-5' exonuclease [Flavivirga aquimarina]|uniref:3'-5' exonuclease n=1 Tax=Flavivirga aquimarina TaxID=2027862 RepID=A0ABT8W989_9FLAO|nr:3'-5' exonuclease [Flavivirga aquimarina]MDO5969661.1 3'-5' exonuclease [Flavivirga aquimarina]